MSSDKSKGLDCYDIVSLLLEHTNGCIGYDRLITESVQKRRGRRYTDVVINHLSREIKAGRYSTDDVKDWLIDEGFEDVSLKEATNIRYRLLKELPIKGWKESEIPKEHMGKMEDYLFNKDLAKEVVAGGKDSVNNLQLVHNGLRGQVPGYDSRITTDTENRFSGTSWQTGRMRSRLRRHGTFIFVDDSRSGINTSGFCFWNICVIDQDRKVQVVMGGMTMSASNEAVQWLFASLVSMTPEAANIVEGLMSDLGKGMMALFLLITIHDAITYSSHICCSIYF